MEASMYLSLTHLQVASFATHIHIQTQLEIETPTREKNHGLKLESMISKLSSCVCEYESVGAWIAPIADLSLSSCQ